MATKVTALPEVSVNSGAIVESAGKAVEVRSKIADLSTEEKELRTFIEDASKEVRAEEQLKGNYIGLIRITGKELPPVRVEFRINNGALNVNEEDTLNTLYGASRPLLFEREKAVTQITDPDALIKELVALGKNPWDYLDIKVKSGLDRAVTDFPSVVSVEAFLPKKGFLATLNEILHTLSDDAKAYTGKYLDKVLNPTVVIGTKGKA